MNDSPSGFVYRMEGNLHVIRNRSGETWREVSFTHSMVRVTNGFRNYSGWSVLPARHPVIDHYNGEGDRFPYWNPAFAPVSIRDKPDELAAWVETGTCPYLAAWKEKTDREIAEHNAKIAAKPKFVPSKPPVPYTNEVWPLPSAPQSEVLKELGPMTTALADGIKAMVAIGETATAKELAMSLKHLIGNASFLLRTDRGKYAK